MADSGAGAAEPPLEFVPNGITPAKFAALIRDESQLVVSIDGRPYSDYVVGHVDGSLSVRLSSLMTRRLAHGRVSLLDLVIDEQKSLFTEAYSKPECHIVVYDCRAGTAGLGLGAYDAKNPLHVILRALQIDKRVHSYICGGFAEFKQQCPELVHVPEVLVRPFGSMGIGLEAPMSATIASPSLSFTHEPSTPMESRARSILTIPPSLILPYIMIGSRKDAEDQTLVRGLGITHVLNMTPDCPCHFEGDFCYLQLKIKDTWNQDLPSYFKRAFEFIDGCRASSGMVLVHCTAGVSRSAALTIAYIMQDQTMRLADAYALVKAKRPIISPNLDFMGELQSFEKTLPGLEEESEEPECTGMFGFPPLHQVSDSSSGSGETSERVSSSATDGSSLAGGHCP